MRSVNPDSPLLSVDIADASTLWAAHMPFIANGGMFIPTSRHFRLGEEVFLLLGLPGAGAKIPLAGKVVWITPEGALGGKPRGIAVQFGDHDDVVRQRINACLADFPDVAHDTYTL